MLTFHLLTALLAAVPMTLADVVLPDYGVECTKKSLSPACGAENILVRSPQTPATVLHHHPFCAKVPLTTISSTTVLLPCQRWHL